MLFLETGRVGQVTFPPFFHDSQVFGKNTEKRGNDHFDLPGMDKSTVVPPIVRISMWRTQNSSARPSPIVIFIRGIPSASRLPPCSSRLEIIGRALRGKGLSPAVIRLLLAGNRSTTHAAYESAWHNSSDWCAGRSHDPLSNDLASILDFLTALNTSGKSYNTVNIHRSMLSVTLEPIVSTPVGQHPLVIRLLKGCYNQNPPLPRYATLWDIYRNCFSVYA